MFRYTSASRSARTHCLRLYPNQIWSLVKSEPEKNDRKIGLQYSQKQKF